MYEFNTLENVRELFSRVNCVGNENCYFVAYKDLTKNTMGMGNSFVNGMINGMKYPYDALLINQNEYGLGIFYLKQEGIPFNYDLSKMNIVKDSYFFVKYDEINRITVKNKNFINNKMKTVIIKLNNGDTHSLYANVNENLLPYHNENFSKFIERYGK